MAAYLQDYDSRHLQLTAKNRDQLRNLMLCNPVWATFTFCPLNQLSKATTHRLHTHTHTHTHTLLPALCPGLPGWAGTRKVKSIWILLEQEIVSGSGISWACASLHLAPDRQPRQQLTTQFFYRPDALPAAQPTVSKHWRHTTTHQLVDCNVSYLYASVALKVSSM